VAASGDFIANFGINKAGFAIAALFVVARAAAIGYWKLVKLDHHWTPSAQALAARSEQGSSH
jgi:hypothetical protein